MKITIPDYLLESILRHYQTLAEAYVYTDGNLKAINAQRVARKEIEKARRWIDKQKVNE